MKAYVSMCFISPSTFRWSLWYFRSIYFYFFLIQSLFRLLILFSSSNLSQIYCHNQLRPSSSHMHHLYFSTPLYVTQALTYLLPQTLFITFSQYQIINSSFHFSKAFVTYATASTLLNIHNDFSPFLSPSKMLYLFNTSQYTNSLSFQDHSISFTMHSNALFQRLWAAFTPNLCCLHTSIEYTQPYPTCPPFSQSNWHLHHTSATATFITHQIIIEPARVA